MIKKTAFKIGTRGSKLALYQANLVKDKIEFYNPGIACEILKIKTTGDKILDKNLYEVGGKGLFIKEIEEALLSKDIDIAVHSMKDMPATFHKDLEISTVLEREDARDAFISNKAENFNDLPQGSVIGTSSPRRASQVLAKRPDLKVIPFRGNVETRLKKLNDGEVDATFLAIAGLKRINAVPKNCYVVDMVDMLPAVAQAAICIENRREDAVTRNVINKLNHQDTYKTTFCERSFMSEFDASCNSPIAAFASINGDEMNVTGLIASLDGSKVVRKHLSGDILEGEGLGKKLAQDLKSQTGDNFWD